MPKSRFIISSRHVTSCQRPVVVTTPETCQARQRVSSVERQVLVLVLPLLGAAICLSLTVKDIWRGKSSYESGRVERSR